MEDISCNHRAWQQRLGRERRPTGYAILYQNEASRAASSSSSQQAAAGRLRGSASEPSLPPSRGGSATGAPRGPHSAPRSGGPAGSQARPAWGAGTGTQPQRTGTGASRGAGSSRRGGTAGSRGWLPNQDASRPETGTSSFRRSGELVLINNGKRRSVPPTPSIRSSMTGASMDSELWREVEQVVAQEVAKVVRPLQAQLQSEAEARQRAEVALSQKGGQRVAAH
mmetsp:Transcript_26825/g.83590  ORF Transcript_26825/g.83590 Transcript_26825/m.83590 type:complete len:225 (-) Transcript_26825:121-795(-)